MQRLRLGVFNEYDRLKMVMVGPADKLPPLVPINSTQKYYYNFDPPDNDIASKEHENLTSVLKDNNVEIFWAQNMDGVDQRDIRDVVTVIGEHLVVCRLKEEIRKREVEGIKNLISSVDPQKVIYCEEGYLEGGDVIIDDDTILVGLGARTDHIGLRLIQDKFSHNFNVVPLVLRGNNALHLDTVLSLISPQKGIIFPVAFDEQSLDFLTTRYSFIEVNKEEQFNLATNILVVEPGRIILDMKRNWRVAEALVAADVNVIDVKYTENNKIGGSFRCATAPLLRLNF